MQTGLAVTRYHRNLDILATGKFPKKIEPSTMHAFNLATIHGARAIGMADKLGSLKVGKQADLIIFNTSTPNMMCAADHDPIVAVVRHATPQDIETVIIAGTLRKEGGTLFDESAEPFRHWMGYDNVNNVMKDGKLTWLQVVQNLRHSRSDVQHRIDRCNIDAATKKIIQMWDNEDGDKILT